MQLKTQQRSPAVRDRHGKRLPQNPSPGDRETSGSSNIPGPVTFTVTVILPSTSSSVSSAVIASPTDSSSSTTLMSSSSTPSTSSLASTSSNTPLSTSTEQQPTISAPVPKPSASATTNNGSGNDTASASTSGPALPIGGIVGVVLGVLLVFIVGIVIAVRKHSLSRRLRLRGWATRQAPSPSFLWIDTGDSSKLPRDRPATPNVAFEAAGTQTRTFAPSSVARIPQMPTRSFQAQNSYNTIIPATASHAPPSQLSESAVVVSTFIPTLPDELPIMNMETIRILSVYDDGWAYCSNGRGEAGMVPLECLARRGVPPGVRGGTRSRDSSLPMSRQPGGRF